MVTMRQLLPLSLLLLLIEVLGGCAAPAAQSTHSVKKALSGGQYTFIYFSGMDAELSNPSITPSVENYFICLPLPRQHEEAKASAALARMEVTNGQLSFVEASAEGQGEDRLFPIVVRKGVAINHRSPKVEFRTVLFRDGGNDWHLAISSKQYSLRQIGEDLAELGAQEAYDISLTTRKGWYRYADAQFELRNKRAPVEELLLFHPSKKP